MAEHMIIAVWNEERQTWTTLAADRVRVEYARTQVVLSRYGDMPPAIEIVALPAAPDFMADIDVVTMSSNRNKANLVVRGRDYPQANGQYPELGGEG